MQKTIYPLIFLLILTACSSDDDSGNSEPQEEELPVTVENLVGTWLAVESIGSGGGSFESIDEDERAIYQFKVDASCVYKNPYATSICDGSFTIEERNILFSNFNDCNNPPVNELSVRLLTKKNLILSSSLFDGSVVKYEKQSLN